MSSSNRSVIAVALIVIIGIAGLGIYIIVYNPFAPPTTTTTTTTTTTPTGNPNPYDVAIVFATGGLGDKSFNDAAYKGAMDAKDQLGIDFTYVEPTTPTEFEGYIRDYTRHVGYDDPYDLIICVGFLQETALGTVANETESANQDYAIIDMWM
ncbi:MAG: BMP family lipoprotein, partial [Candidatus Thorarchaeota archaeon]